MKMKLILIVILSFGASLTLAGIGEWGRVSMDNPTVLELAELAVDDHNKLSTNDYYFKLVKITSVSFQALNGIKYSITFIIGQTKCFKTDPNHKKCDLLHKNIVSCRLFSL